MSNLTLYLNFGPLVFFRSLKSRFWPKKYQGTASEICHKISDDCWNGQYFQTSTTNFPQFWTRDFGWCCKSLMQLGYKKQVHQTLRFAMGRFVQAREITTTITGKGKAFNVPLPAVDSLPYFIHSLKISGFPYRAHKKFLNWQIRDFFEHFIDPITGLVKPEPFSSMKDLSIRKSSCYDNCMVALLANDLKTMHLKSPFDKYDYSKLIKQHFWNGKFFYDDLTKTNYVSGDAQVFPFALGIISDQEMLRSALAEIQKAGLDLPLPLKYTNSEAQPKFIWSEIFAKNYEFDSVWTHMASLYIKLVGTVDAPLAQKYKSEYGGMIKKHQGYLEVFATKNNELKPFSTPFYYCDRAMLWAANYLTL